MSDWFSSMQKDLDNMRFSRDIKSGMASSSDLKILESKIAKLQEKVNNLISMNQKLFDIINNPDWEKVKDNIESEKDDE
jgi:hypothetical protein